MIAVASTPRFSRPLIHGAPGLFISVSSPSTIHAHSFHLLFFFFRAFRDRRQINQISACYIMYYRIRIHTPLLLKLFFTTYACIIENVNVFRGRTATRDLPVAAAKFHLHNRHANVMFS